MKVSSALILVECFQVVGNQRDALDAAVMSDELELHFLVPEACERANNLHNHP